MSTTSSAVWAVSRGRAWRNVSSRCIRLSVASLALCGAPDFSLLPQSLYIRSVRLRLASPGKCLPRNRLLLQALLYPLRLPSARFALPRGDGEGIRDVPDRLDRALVVEDHGDDVEAAGDLPQPLELEIAVRQLAEPVLLTSIHGGLRGIPLGRPARLDLDEDEGLALFRHEVDLPHAGPHVAVHDGEPTPGEETGRFFLPPDPGDLSCVGWHVATTPLISLDPLKLAT